MDIKPNIQMYHQLQHQHQQQQQQLHHHHHHHHLQQQSQLHQQPLPQPPQQQQPEPAAVQSTNSNTRPTQSDDAPPKQVAQAMERLNEAGRLIAFVRIGADRLLEALFAAQQPHQSNKHVQLFVKEDASMRQHLQDLRSIGRQLEESGVLNESLRLRSNSWGLHMPVVCPDGAVVAYAWKRQLAGQAGASAVDRTRLALKAFTDQKKRFFPHIDDGLDSESTESVSKKRCGSHALAIAHIEDISDCKTLPEVIARLEKEVPNVKVSTYERLDWLKRAPLLPASANENPAEASKKHTFHSLNKLRTGSLSAMATDKAAVIELFIPSVFRAVVSLHPAGSIGPDAVAFFSPDEGGSYIHPKGLSVHHVFKQMTEYAAVALQHFLGTRSETALYYVLHWICSYQTLFTKVCSKCGRLLAMDQKLSLFLPPVHRPYHEFSPVKASSAPTTSSSKDQGPDIPAYHIGCLSEDL